MSPKITRTQWKKRITEYCLANGIDKSAGQIERMAIKAYKRVEHEEQLRNATEYEIYEAGLRILGIYTDITPREAVQEMERAA